MKEVVEEETILSKGGGRQRTKGVRRGGGVERGESLKDDSERVDR